MLGVYQEQQEGRRSEGRFRGLPGPPGTGRLQLPGRSRAIAGSRSAVGAPSAARGPEGLPGWGHAVCACAGTRCCVLTPCPPSLRGLALAAQAAAPARPSPLGPRLSPEPPYARLSALVLRASWSQRFSQNVCDTVLVQDSRSRWGEGCCGVLRLLRCSSCPGSAHPCRLIPLCHRARENPASPTFRAV